MITVQQAEALILSQLRDYGEEPVPFEEAMGRVLAEDLVSDRDQPAMRRVTMDGIGIKYNAFCNGARKFVIAATQAAGDAPVDVETDDMCVEIMTGAALGDTLNTVIRYEDVEIADGFASILVDIVKEGQNVNHKGQDRHQGAVLARPGRKIDSTIINLAATIGKTELLVKALPKVAIISTGNELVDVGSTPEPWQVRRSNSYVMKAELQWSGVHADLFHLPDEGEVMEQEIAKLLSRYDVLVFSGGVSMGKYDLLPGILEKAGVGQVFHKVAQRPGKPFWFGASDMGAVVFAFPGNPVSAFMCLHRYFLPWLKGSLGLAQEKPIYAALEKPVQFPFQLQYFMQVNVACNDTGLLTATPVQGNGSGDLANLLDSNAFMELPLEKNTFAKGEVHRVWMYKPLN